MIKSQRFYRYFVSYILITVISLLIMSGVVHQQFLNTMSRQVEQTMMSSLDQFQKAIDQRLFEMDLMANHISRNLELKPYKATSGGYRSFEAVEELKKYLSTNLFVHDIVVHYNGRRADTLFAASGTHELRLFFNKIFKFQHWSEQEFVNMSRSIQTPLLRPVESVVMNQVTTDRFAAYSIPLLANSETPYGSVTFLISEKSFKNLAANVLGDYTGSIYIMGKNNEIVYEYNQGSVEHSSSLERSIGMAPVEENSIITSLTFDKESYTVLKHSSQKYGFHFAAAIPSNQIMHKVNQAENMFNLTVLAILLIGIAFSAALSIRHYKPLHKLIRVIHAQNPSHTPVRADRRKDELEFISTAVSDMIRQNEGLIYQLHSQAIALKEQLLLSLIKGRYKSRKDCENHLRSANIHMQHPHFAVMKLYLDDYEKFCRENSVSTQEHLKSSLIRIVEDQLSLGGEGYGVELIDRRSIVFLFNLPEADSDELLNYAEQIQDLIKRSFHFTVTMGVGRIYSDLTEIFHSYMEASHAVRYRLIRGGNQIINYNGLDQDRVKKEWYPVDAMEHLVRMIKQGDEQAAKRAVNCAFNHIKENRLPLSAAEFICFDIVNHIGKTLMELDIELDQDMNEQIDRLFVPQFETVEQLEQLITCICQSVCHSTMQRKESKNHELLEKITSYIEEHYTDHRLSLDSIADHLGISPSYATRYYKSQTGDSLMRYIDSMRMRKAKDLLKSTDLTLKDILMEVGYMDPTNFIRKFKKNEGVTPIQYRNLVNPES